MSIVDRAYWEKEYLTMEDSTLETKQQGAFISDFDDLLGHVSRLPLKDQKDLSEDILRRFTEGHWECHWDGYNLSVSKTESL